MTIFIDDNESVKEEDMKDTAKKLDASDLPNGKYNFLYSNTKDENHDSISYSFKVKDGKVVFMRMRIQYQKMKIKNEVSKMDVI